MLFYLSNLFLFFFPHELPQTYLQLLYYTIVPELRCRDGMEMERIRDTKEPFAIYLDWSATLLPAESAQLPAAGKQ